MIWVTNFLLTFVKFLPFTLFIVALYIIGLVLKRYTNISERMLKEANVYLLIAMLINLVAAVAFSIVSANSYTMLTEPVRKMGNEHLQTQMTIEYTLQDNTRQPKQTDEERAKRFEELTNYKED